MTASLPVGKWRNRPLSDVDTSYLSWVYRDWKLSSGLRIAVADELQRRGLNVSRPPPPSPPRCPDCLSPGEPRFTWAEDTAGRKRIRAECGACGRFIQFAPEIEPYSSMADESASR